MKKVSTLFFFTVALLIVAVNSVSAEQLTIHFSQQSLRNRQIITYVRLKGNISYDTVDAIRNGITAKFFITFQLSNSQGFMGVGRKTISEKVETFTVSYDVWENYFIIQDKNRGNSHSALSSSEIISKINKIINPLSFDASSLRKNEPLFLRAKIKIQTIKLFPPFGIFLLFFDPWNYESNWINSDVFVLKKL